MALPPVPSSEARARLVPVDGPDLGRRSPSASDEAQAGWHAVVWGRLGRGDLAAAWWRTVDPEGPLGSWRHYEQALVLRELGLHAEAQELDGEGLARATELVDVVALRLSFAADAVGLGDAGAARSRFEAASDLLRELEDTPVVARQRLRRSWVAVEIALLEGHRPPTDGLPEATTEGEVRQPDDARHGTDHHRAKGLLFGAVARQQPELLRHAAALAPPALLWAVELARVDSGDASAPARAVAAWREIHAPPEHAAAALRTSTARRLAVLEELTRRD